MKFVAHQLLLENDKAIEDGSMSEDVYIHELCIKLNFLLWVNIIRHLCGRKRLVRKKAYINFSLSTWKTKNYYSCLPWITTNRNSRILYDKLHLIWNPRLRPFIAITIDSVPGFWLMRVLENCLDYCFNNRNVVQKKWLST